MCDHFTGKVIWAAKGRSKATVGEFFDALEEAEAIGPGGHPRARPHGDVERILEELAPAVARQMLVEAASDYPPNVFDTVLSGEGSRVRGGVRMSVGTESQHLQAAPSYCYVSASTPDRFSARKAPAVPERPS